MTKNEKTISHILEIVHPVLLIALAGPVFYTLWETRVDGWVLPMYLAGFFLMPLSAIARIAVRKVHSMWAFLLISGAVFVVTVVAGSFLPLSGTPKWIVLVELVLGGLWITVSAIRLRIRENLRERAKQINDITWKENSILTEKPNPVFAVFFVAAYLVGLLTACSPTCNIALASGVVYLLGALAYRSFEVAGDYLQETQNLANVPEVKICLIRRQMLAAILGVLVALSAVGFLTAGARTYRDLRKWEWEPVAVSEDPMEYGDQSAAQDPMIEIADELREQAEVVETPAWLKFLERVAMAVVLVGVAAAFVRGIWRSLLGAAKDFEDIPEENGDVAKRLDDVSEDLALSDSALARLRRALSGRQLTEKEQVRQEYRRAIRKFRKTAPERSATPSEIERGTAFPEGFDAAGLHERYEQARYGR